MLPATPSVIAVLDDLIFLTKIRAAGNAAGVVVTQARSTAEVTRLLELLKPALVIVDMNSAQEHADDVIGLCRKNAGNPYVVAFLSHVDAHLARRARDAGAYEVLARSAFTQRLDEIISHATHSADAAD